MSARDDATKKAKKHPPKDTETNEVRDKRYGSWSWFNDEILDHYASEIGPNGIAVYMLFARRANKQQVCFPSLDHIAQTLGVSRHTVIDAINKLEAVGLIARKKRFSASTVYVLLRPKVSSRSAKSALLTDCPEVQNLHSRSAKSALPEVQNLHSNQTYREPEPIEPDKYIYVDSRESTGTHVSPSAIEIPVIEAEQATAPATREVDAIEEAQTTTSLTPEVVDNGSSTPPTDNSASQTQPKKIDYSPGFARCWAIYPPERRVGKGKCYLIWKRKRLEARTDEVCTVVAGNVAGKWSTMDPKFIPTSETFLNQDRYDDGILPLDGGRPVLSEKTQATVQAAMRFIARQDEDQRHDDVSTKLLDTSRKQGHIEDADASKKKSLLMQPCNHCRPDYPCYYHQVGERCMALYETEEDTNVAEVLR
jgi:hypothetical protein